MTIKQLAEEYLNLTEQLDEIRERRNEVRDKLNWKLAGKGRMHDTRTSATGYSVGETKVRSYFRRGYHAVRVTRHQYKDVNYGNNHFRMSA
jgi:hypothetical protein